MNSLEGIFECELPLAGVIEPDGGEHTVLRHADMGDLPEPLGVNVGANRVFGDKPVIFAG